MKFYERNHQHKALSTEKLKTKQTKNQRFLSPNIAWCKLLAKASVS